MDDAQKGGIELLRDMLKGRQAKRLGALSNTKTQDDAKKDTEDGVMEPHPKDGSTEGDLKHEQTKDAPKVSAADDGDDADEDDENKHPFAAKHKTKLHDLVMKQLDRAIKPKSND